MARQSLGAGLVAVVALVAFGVAAGSVAAPDLRGGDEPAGREVDLDADPTGVLPPATSERCLFCSTGGLNGLVAAYLPALSDRALALLAAAGAAVLGALWYRAGGDDEPDEALVTETPAVEARDPTTTDVAHVPASLDDPPADNAVYRAWNRLVERVDPSRPPHWTPGEYASRAREAGLDGEAVDAVTRLFREVRYGEASPTADRERRATDAVERVEAGTGTGGAGERSPGDHGEGDHGDDRGDPSERRGEAT